MSYKGMNSKQLDLILSTNKTDEAYRLAVAEVLLKDRKLSLNAIERKYKLGENTLRNKVEKVKIIFSRYLTYKAKKRGC